MTKGVINAYKEYETIMTPSKFKKIIKSFSPIGELISNMSKGIKDIIELEIPIYDENGNVVGKQKLNENDFTDLKTNLNILMTGTSQSIVDIADNMKNSDLDPSSKKFKAIIESFVPIGEFISKLATGIKDYASATYTDENGKKIHVTPEYIQEAGTNISTLLTTVTNSLIDYYNDPKYTKLFDKDIIKNIGTQYKEITEVISSIIDSIKKIGEIKNDIIITSLNNLNTIFNGTKKDKSDSLINIICSAFSDNISYDSNKLKTIQTIFTDLFDTINILNKNLTENEIKNIPEQKIIAIIDSITNIINKFKPGDSFWDDNKNVLNIANKFKTFDLINGYISSSIKKISKLIDNIDKLNINNLYYEEVNDENKETKNKINKITKVLNSISNITNILNSNTNVKIDREKINKLKKELGLIDNLIDVLKNSFKKLNKFNKAYETDNNFDNISIAIKKFNIAFANIKKELEGDPKNNIPGLSNESIKNLAKLEYKVETFSNIVRDLIKASSDSIKNPKLFEQIGQGISTINSKLNEVNSNNAEKIDNEVRSLDKFVKSVDRIDLVKVTKMTSLMEAMSNLADKMGGFDKLAELLDGDFIEILTKLNDTVNEAKQSIETSERINKQRQQELKKNIEEFSKLMDKNIVVGVSELDKDGNLKVSSEKIKKS